MRVVDRLCRDGKVSGVKEAAVRETGGGSVVRCR